MKHNSYSEQSMSRHTSALFYSLLFLWIFLLPTNLFWKILPNFGFVGGLQIDYLIPKLYLTDIVGLLLMIVGIVKLQSEQSAAGIASFWKKSKTHVVGFAGLGMLLLFCLVRQAFTPFPLSGYWFAISVCIRLATGAIIGFLFPHNRRIISATLFWGMLSAVFFQSVVGLYQFTVQKEVAGFLFLGEPTLTTQIGIDKTNWSWLDDTFHTRLGLRIAPYGTTPHPNVLAGFLAVSVSQIWAHMLKLKTKPFVQKTVILTVTILGLVTLFLTQSVTGWLTLCLGVVVVTQSQIQKKFQFQNRVTANGAVFLVLFISILFSACVLNGLDRFSLGEESVDRRLSLQHAAFQLIFHHPVFGTGMNQITAAVEEFQTGSEVVRFVQPTHQFTLLFLTENGALGLLSCIVFMLIIPNKRALSALCITCIILFGVLSFDHYLYTLPQGQLLVGVLLICIYFGF